MAFHAVILTLYPDMFPGPLAYALSGRALQKGIWSFEARYLRDFTRDRHCSVDDRPAGGGPGMVMRADILARAIDAGPLNCPRFLMSPRGDSFNQSLAREISVLKEVLFICGRFEGVDERIIKARNLIEVSIGDYIVSGGEISVFVILDSVVRLLPGVMGNVLSSSDESFETGLLEYPQYTRPRCFENQAIPEILISGNHREVKKWRKEQSESVTQARRSDLWSLYKRKNYDKH
ncbi:MAG: tRNA (guanine37-N1)-methyltransferase [Candidatus Tokpelaia sp. JSC161]|jgi:tRNA (guanine37-N1)-methyltransferase|nr:MAG: tRNA (guanine37-N1)-methyltransferase [Candidatus Tokpelaia sp. JSC161]